MRSVRGAAGSGLLWMWAITGCGGGPADPVPAQPPLLLAVGDIEIPLAEAEQWLPYLDQVDRRASRNAKLRMLLTLHLLPIELARRAHAAQRAELRAQAESMVRVAGNGGFGELLTKGRNYGAYRPQDGFLRNELPLSVARYAFDPANLGRVSPVLETPQGFAVVAVADITPGSTSLLDRVDAVVVPFYTHPPAEFGAWLQGATAELANLPLRIDPAHRDAMPEYLRQ